MVVETVMLKVYSLWYCGDLIARSITELQLGILRTLTAKLDMNVLLCNL